MGELLKVNRLDKKMPNFGNNTSMTHLNQPQMTNPSTDNQLQIKKEWWRDERKVP